MFIEHQWWIYLNSHIPFLHSNRILFSFDILIEISPWSAVVVFSKNKKSDNSRKTSFNNTFYLIPLLPFKMITNNLAVFKKKFKFNRKDEEFFYPVCILIVAQFNIIFFLFYHLKIFPRNLA